VSIRTRLTLWSTALLAAVLTGLALLVYSVVSDQMADRLDNTLRERTTDVQERVYRAQTEGRGGAGTPGESALNDEGSIGQGGSWSGYPTSGSIGAIDGGTTLLRTNASPVTTGNDSPDRRNDDRGSASPACGEETPRLVNVDLPGESLYVELHDQCGNVDVRSTNLAEALPIAGRTVDKVLGGKDVLFTTTTGTGELRVYGTKSGADRRDAGALFVATPLDPLRSDLQRLRLALIAIVLGTTVVSAAIGWFLAAKAMQPVDRMTRAAHAIGETADVSKRLPEPEQRDEIGRLAETFNEMLGRLHQAFTTQRQFLADASHELRTPLTVIRANVERVRRDPAMAPPDRDDALRVVEREVDRMGRLVDDLLSLARSDAGVQITPRRIGLDGVLLDVYNQQRALAGPVRLELGEFEPVEIDGDADRLKQVLLNLIENALRHTQAGGSVTLDLETTSQEAILRVRDTGSGIAPEHVPHIFERFYRADVARSRRGGGAGLGLAIAREIVVAHGGTIAVESRPGAGTTFTVTLPRPNAAASVG
jgi:signal transduction histidine kinase